jgi:hypothetical protein
MVPPDLAHLTPFSNSNTRFLQKALLKHGLEILSDVERRLGLGLDLLHSDAVGNLDEGEAVGEVNIEHTLDLLA